MSAPRWRSRVTAVWIALTCITFIAIGSIAARSWLLLLVFSVIPPAILLWLWNEDRPLLMGWLRQAQEAGVNPTGEHGADTGPGPG